MSTFAINHYIDRYPVIDHWPDYVVNCINYPPYLLRSSVYLDFKPILVKMNGAQRP